MNDQQPSNQTGMNSTFSTGTNPQTNPFTADLKGEFTSNFGTNTNAVSQIFKDGGFGSQSPTKWIIAGVVLVAAAVGLGVYFLSDSDEGPDVEFPIEDAAEEGETAATDEALEGEGAAEGEEGAAAGEESAYEEEGSEAGVGDEEYGMAQSAAPPVAEPVYQGGGSVSLISPASGQVWQYDETTGSAPFQWEGGGWIVISRSPNMRPEYIRARGQGGTYEFKNPYPGTWYWQVRDGSSASEVRSFTVASPVRRNIAVTQPAAGGAIAAEGGVVAWQGDKKVAFYRVEFAANSFASPDYKFATSGNSVQVTGMQPGQYQMRIGAFSEVAGRWEYTAPSPVTVQ